MATKLEGTISRININHASHHVTFMLENDEKMYRLVFGRFLRRLDSQPLDLTQPGDVIAVTYCPSRGDAIDGDIERWENLTLGVTSACPSDQL